MLLFLLSICCHLFGEQPLIPSLSNYQIHRCPVVAGEESVSGPHLFLEQALSCSTQCFTPSYESCVTRSPSVSWMCLNRIFQTSVWPLRKTGRPRLTQTLYECHFPLDTNTSSPISHPCPFLYTWTASLYHIPDIHSQCSLGQHETFCQYILERKLAILLTKFFRDFFSV